MYKVNDSEGFVTFMNTDSLWNVCVLPFLYFTCGLAKKTQIKFIVFSVVHNDT